jgi:hypothetical protein
VKARSIRAAFTFNIRRQQNLILSTNHRRRITMTASRKLLSLDTWAVLLCCLLAALVRAGVVKTVSW